MRPVLLSPVLLLLAAAPAPSASTHRTPAPATEPRGSAVVVLAPRPGTALDATARQLVAHDIAAGKQANEAPLVLTGSAPLGTASDRPALFVQLQSARECGSAGCSTTVYLWQRAGWQRVLDGVGGRLTVGTTRTHGMADLMTEKGRYVWTGHAYEDPNPVPAIDLRPRR